MNTEAISRFLVTDRLLLRPWEPTDAYDLYENAKDEDVARAAGWLHHTSPEYSLGIIENRLMKPATYAIVPKDIRRPIGSISLMFRKDANFPLEDNEAELGYWVGKRYWGNGYVPEAADELIRHGLKDIGIERIWCICRLDNPNSIRVQDKCGFRFIREGRVNDPVYGELNMRFTYIERS